MATLKLDQRGLIVTCDGCQQKNRIAFERLGESSRCGQCKQAMNPGATPLDVATDEDFERLLSSSAVPVVVDYWAPWCGPCRMVAPELEKVAARSAGRYLVVKVNTDVLADLGTRHAVRSIPTLAVFSDGREITRSSGARPAADIEAFIAQAISTLG